MKLTFLGTGGAVPTAERNHIGVLLSYGAEHLLIDCGEGIQRQFYKARISPTKVTRLLITHLHGDHILGIPGILQTLGFSEYNKTLHVYGPARTRKFINYVTRMFPSHNAWKVRLKIKEIKAKRIINEKDFAVFAAKLKHASGYGYRFQEKDRRRIRMSYIKKLGIKPGPILKRLHQGKNIVWKGKKVLASKATYIVKGKSVAFVFDTGYCTNAIKLAKNTDVVLAEATYLKEHEDLAKKRGHLTAQQAAIIAKKAGARKLILLHFGRRYMKKESRILAEAKKVFKNTRLARDLMSVKV